MKQRFWQSVHDIIKEMCISVIEEPARKEVQDDGERVRFWGAVPELDGRFLRVITLSDHPEFKNLEQPNLFMLFEGGCFRYLFTDSSKRHAFVSISRI